MKRMASKQLRGLAQLLGLTLVVACSVEDLQFVPDSELEMPDEGDAGTGATHSSGGSGTSNKAGSSNKAGTDAGTGGSSSSTGGKAIGGGSTGGNSALAGRGGSDVAGGPPLGGSGGGTTMPECPTPAGDPMQPLLDDFNDMNAGLPMPMMAGRAGGWYITADGTGGKLTQPTDMLNLPPNPVEKPDFNMKGYALRFAGSGFSDWGVALGVTLLNVPGRPPCPYDLSRHSTISFWIRGTVTPSMGVTEQFRVNLVTTETADMQRGGTCDSARERCFDNYQMTFNDITPTWKQVVMKFADFKQQGFGTVKPKDMHHVMNIEFAVPAHNTFDISLDQIEFH